MHWGCQPLEGESLQGRDHLACAVDAPVTRTGPIRGLKRREMERESQQHCLTLRKRGSSSFQIRGPRILIPVAFLFVATKKKKKVLIKQMDGHMSTQAQDLSPKEPAPAPGPDVKSYRDPSG